MKQRDRFRHLVGPLAVLLLAGSAMAFAPVPADAPQEEKIYFTTVSGDGHKMSIAVMKPDGSKRTILSKEGANEMDPAPSPNGKRIAFVVINREDSTADVWVMNAAGKERKKLTEHAPKTFPMGLSWSPDGKRLAYSTITSKEGSGPHNQIMVIDADGKNRTPLVKGLAPAWSPDGKKILYTSLEDGAEKEPRLAIMDADGKNAKLLTTKNVVAGTWSPDGKKIVYAGVDSPKPHVYVSKPDGTGATQITQDDGDLGELEARFSQDGKRIYVTRMAFQSRSEKVGIWVMDADGKNLKELSNGDVIDLLGSAGLFSASRALRSAPRKP